MKLHKRGTSRISEVYPTVACISCLPIPDYNRVCFCAQREHQLRRLRPSREEFPLTMCANAFLAFSFPVLDYAVR